MLQKYALVQKYRVLNTTLFTEPNPRIYVQMHYKFARYLETLLFRTFHYYEPFFGSLEHIFLAI